MSKCYRELYGDVCDCPACMDREYERQSRRAAENRAAEEAFWAEQDDREQEPPQQEDPRTEEA